MTVKEKLDQLPPDYPNDLLVSIRDEFIKSGKTIVVLDDDPTGTQTCKDVTVLTSWGTDEIAQELKNKPSILFILTNSRSMIQQEAVRLTQEIGYHLKAAAKETNTGIVVISRSDSTLRGHFPAEVDAIASALDMDDAIRILVPAFIEGDRYTIDDVHYIIENNCLVPVSDTPFAKDQVFGYTQANLKKWVEEKTKGGITASNVHSISLADIRIGGPGVVTQKLLSYRAGEVCIVNAVSYRDLEVFVMAAMLAEKGGKTFLYRTSATFVPIRAGMESGKMYLPKNEYLNTTHGSLVVVGSHVPKTTSQLNWLLSIGNHNAIEIMVPEILKSDAIASMAHKIIKQIDFWLTSGKKVLIYTSRKLEVGRDSEDSLKINATVSDFLVRVVQGLTIRPAFIIAKGGITSSDLATKALGSKKATVLGPVIPGVPVWQLDKESKFPGISFVVFPGNVGGEKALEEVLNKLNNEGKETMKGKKQ